MQGKANTRFNDLLRKILQLSSIVFVFYFYFYLINKFNAELEVFNLDVNIYSNLSNILFLPTLFTSLVILYFFAMEVKLSNFNNTKVEKWCYKILNKLPQYEISRKIYNIIGLILATLMFYVFLEIFVVYVNTKNMILEIDWTTVSKLPHYNYIAEKVQILSIFLISIFLFFICSKNEKSFDKAFFFGVFVLHFLIPIDKILFFLNEENTITQIITKDMSGMDKELYYFSLLGILLSSLFCVFFLVKENHFKYLKRQSLKILSGYILGRLLFIMTSFLILNGTSIELFKNNPNIKKVTINNQNYYYNATMLKYSQNDIETESLLEAYEGLNIHNTFSVLNYMVSKEDKELLKGIDFSAKLQLRNALLLDSKKEKMIAQLQEGVNYSDAVNALVPLIIYSDRPLSFVKNTLESIIKKEYQKAIDFYIKDYLNNKSDIYCNLSGKKIAPEIHGDEFLILIKSLVNNKLAIIDYSKIKNESLRNKLKLKIEEKSKVYKTYTQEEIEDWMTMFNL